MIVFTFDYYACNCTASCTCTCTTVPAHFYNRMPYYDEITPIFRDRMVEAPPKNYRWYLSFKPVLPVAARAMQHHTTPRARITQMECAAQRQRHKRKRWMRALPAKLAYPSSA